MSLRVVLEVAPKRTFASALDWPGWARSGRDPDAALAALVGHRERYAAVARGAGEQLPRVDRGDLDVIERLPGSGATEFGVPGAIASAEAEPLDGPALERLAGLLRATWDAFDAAAAAAEGVELRTGPRGGGRDLAKIRGHVAEAEIAYLGQLGSRPPADHGVEAVRRAFEETLHAVVTGTPITNPRNTRRPWPPRYAIRRAAWHTLDHAWEIEDRAG